MALEHRRVCGSESGSQLLSRLDEMSRELKLLLACARVFTSPDHDAAIRGMLDERIDWTLFARKAIDHELAALAGHTMSRVAPDMVPEEILNALRLIADRTRAKNRALFDELIGIVGTLADNGIEAIPLKGPVLALRIYGDLGLRAFRDLDFLVRDSDISRTIEILRTQGYERKIELTQVQFDLIHRLQGQEILFKEGVGTAIEPHTRLTPISMALDIDYAGLWRRAQTTKLNGHALLTLAPEDDLIALAIHGGKEMWWNIKWVCDVSLFVAASPTLDWNAVVEQARAQGCLRAVLLAASLARQCFDAQIPEAIMSAGRTDPIIGYTLERVLKHWESDEPLGPPSNKSVSLDRLRLHDGAVRRARYVAQTLLLPAPVHITLLRLPRHLSFAYIPIKIAHDLIALPLWRVYRQLAGQDDGG